MGQSELNTYVYYCIMKITTEYDLWELSFQSNKLYFTNKQALQLLPPLPPPPMMTTAFSLLLLLLLLLPTNTIVCVVTVTVYSGIHAVVLGVLAVTNAVGAVPSRDTQ